jgi:hypothetical protein
MPSFSLSAQLASEPLPVRWAGRRFFGAEIARRLFMGQNSGRVMTFRKGGKSLSLTLGRKWNKCLADC